MQRVATVYSREKEIKGGFPCIRVLLQDPGRLRLARPRGYDLALVYGGGEHGLPYSSERKAPPVKLQAEAGATTERTPCCATHACLVPGEQSANEYAPVEGASVIGILSVYCRADAQRVRNDPQVVQRTL